jgi:hypothetical protein
VDSNIPKTFLKFSSVSSSIATSSGPATGVSTTSSLETFELFWATNSSGLSDTRVLFLSLFLVLLFRFPLNFPLHQRSVNINVMDVMDIIQIKLDFENCKF